MWHCIYIDENLDKINEFLEVFRLLSARVRLKIDFTKTKLLRIRVSEVEEAIV